nr:unnamed protein product [Spirometra erinaceieuropaei]
MFHFFVKASRSGLSDKRRHVGKSGLVPTSFSATVLNSSAIRVTWKKPRRSDELSSKYELIVYNSTHEVGFTLRVTEDIIANLEPSTTYNLTAAKQPTCDSVLLSAFEKYNAPEKSALLVHSGEIIESGQGCFWSLAMRRSVGVISREFSCAKTVASIWRVSV